MSGFHLFLRKHYGSGHIQVAKLLVSHGGTHGDLGDHKEKKELLEQAFPIFEEHYGPDHPEVAKLLADLCEVYGTLGDHKKQQESFARAVSIFKEHQSPNHF
ncbi:MAG: tetratricopeptide repeat protein [Wolbachia endosymbiont of Halictus tumulorum]|nr:tetratricopeptide repeat protein [Wolbachia endosymbiont of Halictus tumulorum]